METSSSRRARALVIFSCATSSSFFFDDNDNEDTRQVRRFFYQRWLTQTDRVIRKRLLLSIQIICNRKIHDLHTYLEKTTMIDQYLSCQRSRWKSSQWQFFFFFFFESRSFSLHFLLIPSSFFRYILLTWYTYVDPDYDIIDRLPSLLSSWQERTDYWYSRTVEITSITI